MQIRWSRVLQMFCEMGQFCISILKYGLVFLWHHKIWWKRLVLQQNSKKTPTIINYNNIIAHSLLGVLNKLAKANAYFGMLISKVVTCIHLKTKLASKLCFLRWFQSWFSIPIIPSSSMYCMFFKNLQIIWIKKCWIDTTWNENLNNY